MVGEMGNKAFSSFNSVEVEVEDELGKNKKKMYLRGLRTILSSDIFEKKEPPPLFSKFQN